MYVRPVPDRLVRMPQSMQPLPADGCDVERSAFWLRRIKEGDVELVEPTKKPSPEIEE